MGAKRRKRRKTIRPEILLKPLLVIISMLMVISLIRTAISEYCISGSSEIKEEDILLASRITDEDARYHYLLGLLYHDSRDKGDTGKAIKSYHLSLERNPTNARAWLAIARAYRDSGMKEEAKYAIRKALSMDRNSPGLIWEAGVLYLIEDNPVEATGLFKKYLYMIPDEQENVYSLYYMMRVDPTYILDNLIFRDYIFYKRYLNFLMTHNLLNESFEVWKRIRYFNPERSEYLNYCDFLIKTGEIKGALALWDEFINKFGVLGNNKSSPEAIWNGDFELAIENGGFDWKIGKADGLRIFMDRIVKRTGYKSLSADFDGRHNPGVYLAWQVVAVEPGKSYKVKGFIKTENITTKNGIFLEVAGFKCDTFVKRAESVTGTNLWKKIELEFTVPESCRAAKIGIGRERSEKFDNKIAGDVWIDSISMTPINK
ncbi:MAG: hypothetical protein AB1638_08215 [Nitrospirota bacterium]